MVRRYKPEDFSQVQSWLEHREMKVIHPSVLSQTGFIVDDTAVLFLYKTDSDVCYLENLFSNRESIPEYRNHAISLLIDEAFQEAKTQGFKFVMSVTDVPAVIARAVASGCQIEPNKVLLTKQLY